MHRVACGAASRQMRLCLSPRDSACPGHGCISATDIRPRRALPVTLSLVLALWRRRLSLSRCLLGVLADTRGGSARTYEHHAGCDEY
jgi:hypothetical protein